jgi:hypothetical protein
VWAILCSRKVFGCLLESTKAVEKTLKEVAGNKKVVAESMRIAAKSM